MVLTFSANLAPRRRRMWRLSGSSGRNEEFRLTGPRLSPRRAEPWPGRFEIAQCLRAESLPTGVERRSPRCSAAACAREAALNKVVQAEKFAGGKPRIECRASIVVSRVGTACDKARVYG
jgi:hypothetical protein